MNNPSRPNRNIEAVGPVGMIVNVIAARTTDEGVAISCEPCGHVFVESRPLSDESEPARNTDLARELWLHICDRPGRQARKPVSNALRQTRG